MYVVCFVLEADDECQQCDVSSKLRGSSVTHASAIKSSKKKNKATLHVATGKKTCSTRRPQKGIVAQFVLVQHMCSMYHSMYHLEQFWQYVSSSINTFCRLSVVWCPNNHHTNLLGGPLYRVGTVGTPYASMSIVCQSVCLSACLSHGHISKTEQDRPIVTIEH